LRLCHTQSRSFINYCLSLLSIRFFFELVFFFDHLCEPNYMDLTRTSHPATAMILLLWRKLAQVLDSKMGPRFARCHFSAQYFSDAPSFWHVVTSCLLSLKCLPGVRSNSQNKEGMLSSELDYPCRSEGVLLGYPVSHYPAIPFR
jgi:hypothetical protein